MKTDDFFFYIDYATFVIILLDDGKNVWINPLPVFFILLINEVDLMKFSMKLLPLLVRHKIYRHTVQNYWFSMCE